MTSRFAPPKKQMCFCPSFILLMQSSMEVSSEILFVVYQRVRTAKRSRLAWSSIRPSLMFFWKFFQNLLKVSTLRSQAEVNSPSSFSSSSSSSEKSSSSSSGSGLKATKRSTDFLRSFPPIAFKALSCCKFSLLTLRGKLSESTKTRRKLRYLGNSSSNSSLTKTRLTCSFTSDFFSQNLSN